MKKWLIIAISVFVLGCILWVGFWYATRSFGGWERYTVVESKNGEVWVRSFDAKTDRGVRIKLPRELQIETSSGRGMWRISALPKLAEKYGKVWLSDSVADALGVFYQKYDAVLWWWYSRDVEWKDVDMVELGLVREVTLPDGVRVWELTEKWDLVAHDYFVSVGLSTLSLEAEVVNTTGVGGLGAHAARAIANLGIRVVMLSEQETEVDRCMVVAGSPLVKSEAVKYLALRMNCAVQEGEEERIKIFVGKKYLQWWKGV